METSRREYESFLVSNPPTTRSNRTRYGLDAFNERRSNWLVTVWRADRDSSHPTEPSGETNPTPSYGGRSVLLQPLVLRLRYGTKRLIGVRGTGTTWYRYCKSPSFRSKPRQSKWYRGTTNGVKTKLRCIPIWHAWRRLISSRFAYIPYFTHTHTRLCFYRRVKIYIHATFSRPRFGEGDGH